MRLLIILILGIHCLTLGQDKKPCYDKIYQVTDTLPTLISSTEKLLEIIKREIKIPDSLQNRTGRIFIQYVINCRGEIVNLRGTKLADSDGKIIINEFEFLSRQIIKILKNNLEWSPARHGGKTVDFLQVFAVLFNKGEITISGNAP